MNAGLPRGTALLWLVALVTVGMSACSNRAIYDNLQVYQRQECRDQPMPSQEQCLERARQSYRAYQRERREALDP